MPKDDFERLERRWRERPLFLERPSRKPFWVLLVLLLAVGLLLGFAAIDPPSPDAIFDRLTKTPAETPPEQTAHVPPNRLRIPLATSGR